MIYFWMFLATLAYVTLRAFQQRNVVFENYKWLVPTCYAMQAIDIYVIVTVAQKGWGFLLVITNGTAALCGCLLAIWFHKRFVQR